MSLLRTIRTFEGWRQGGDPLVLATVFDTAGSTYTKPGHRIVISASGDYQGLVSGGCLEGDLAEHARGVVEQDRPVALSYDMRGDADELFGLGIGCNGLLRIFLQPLLPTAGYAPFSRMAELSLSRSHAAAATVIEPGDTQAAPGACVIWRDGELETHGGHAPEPDLLAAELKLAAGGVATYARSQAGPGILFAPIRNVPRLLVLGAGLDAMPVVSMASELGWIVSVGDHRPAYLERPGFELAERRALTNPLELASSFDARDFDAVLVMSHHLQTDIEYVRQLAGNAPAWLGVLGPGGRRDRILDALGPAADRLRSRLRGPVGLDIGADSPEAIALSVVAELQAFMASDRRQQSGALPQSLRSA